MLRKSIILLTLCLLLPASLASAQSAPSLAELQISFWPEYDQRAMLVIYRGTLAEGTPLPAPLQFTMPARFGPPIAVAFTDPNGQLFNLDHTTSISGDTLTIAFDAPTNRFQFEYYDTSLDLSTSTRRYSFATLAPYPVARLELQFQQPPGATEVSLTPAFGEPFLGGDGLTYNEIALADVSANTPVTLELTYVKTTDSLTASLPSAVVTPEVPAQTGGLAADPMLPIWIALGVLAVAMVGGGIFWLMRSQSKQVQEAAPTRRPKTKGNPPRPREVRPAASHREAATPPTAAPPMAAPTEPEPVVFCHECGQQSRPGDRFCRNCGTELRLEG